MVDVSIYLKSKKKPICLILETVRQQSIMLEKLKSEKFVDVGYFVINCEEISYILFKNVK